MKPIKQFINHLKGRKKDSEIGSLSINDPAIIEAFIDNLDNTFFVSFPRTGSHWLRMIMELYFEKPSLVRIFFYKKTIDFTCYHTHDLDLDVKRRKVIYLYRDPVETIYSQLNYQKENLNDLSRIYYWANLYAKHLDKWLISEKFSNKKTILTYEGMKNDIHKEFKKICDHYDVPFNSERLNIISRRVNKEEVKKKTTHDKQVINISNEYKINRINFVLNEGDYIWECIMTQNPDIKKFF